MRYIIYKLDLQESKVQQVFRFNSGATEFILLFMKHINVNS